MVPDGLTVTIGVGSFDAMSGSLDAPGGVLDFDVSPHDTPVILNPTTREVVSPAADTLAHVEELDHISTKR